MDVFVSLMIMPLNAIDERNYHAQRNNAFSSGQTFSGSHACAAVHVNWNMSPGITFNEIGDIATVYVNNAGSTR